MNAASHGFIQRYRIAPDLQRCCWYCLVTAIVVPIIAAAVYDVEQWDATDWSIGSLFVGGSLVFMITALRWHLDVGPHGITRCIGPVRDFWAWEEFANGTISKQPRSRLRHRGKRWPFGQLGYSYLADDDIRRLVAIVNQHFVVPAAPSLPAECELKRWLQPTLVFDAHGLTIRPRKQPARTLAWHEVERVLITREDPLRDDFSKLVFQLPDGEEIGLLTHEGKPTWQGATLAEVNAWCTRYLDESQIDVAIHGEPDCSTAHQERRQRQERKVQRESNQCLLVCAILTLIGFVYFGIVEGWLQATVLFLPFVLMFAGLREIDKQRTKNERERRASNQGGDG